MLATPATPRRRCRRSHLEQFQQGKFFLQATTATLVSTAVWRNLGLFKPQRSWAPQLIFSPRNVEQPVSVSNNPANSAISGYRYSFLQKRKKRRQGVNMSSS